MRKILLSGLFAFGIIVLGSFGSYFTSQSIGGWYPTLIKPAFNPPNWLFGPVWTVLFGLMGISLFLVYSEGIKKRKVRFAVGLFTVHFILNITWSYLFFGLRNPFYAFIEIVILWLVIGYMLFKFYKIKPLAGLLLLPYILWVTFAAVLNYFIFVLNK